MNSQAAIEVANLAKESVAPKVVDLYAGKKLIAFNGEIETHDVPVPARHVEALDLASFGKAALAYGCTQLWLSAEQFVGIKPEAEHNAPKVIFKPIKSAVFDLISLARSYEQSQLILLLRTVLRDAIAPAGLLGLVRNIKVVNASTLVSDQQATGSKMGREIVNEATGAGLLPEDLSVTTKVFEDWTSRHEDSTFNIAFAVDASQPPKFHFTPTRQEIEHAIRYALEEAEAEFKEIDSRFQIFRGKPLAGV